MDKLLERAGEKIELISKSEIRYSGVLERYEKAKEVLVIGQVVSHGTEERVQRNRIEGSSQVYEYIVFKRDNIREVKFPRVEDKWIELEEQKPAPEAEEGASLVGKIRLSDGRKEKGHHHHRGGGKKGKSRGSSSALDRKVSLPEEDFDFNGNNSKIKKERPRRGDSLLYYDSSVSFFDTLS